ncbi:hypothetical protein [Tichowtungia aerotolerans]|uniref:Uncharacterized protein n=1 Tax=Tichowtungia aerotolerans TaxID=2697043 RepID=A0A6P1M945_9BACT|nr:hypothetical protein [Tichowtungia aerotolerans]QHI69064.1 hypothetical protein GT409_06265 [Tichowtungia aerotolerans]
MWTDSEGNSFAGELSKVVLGRVYIRDVNGKTRSVSLDSLSKSEREYLSSHVPPELEITVRKKDRELPRFAWSSLNYYTTLYTFSITLTKQSRLDYRGDLTVELFVIGQDLAVGSNDFFVLMHYSRSVCQLPDGRKSFCQVTVDDVRFEHFIAGYIQLSSAAERGKEYVGYIVTVSDSNGRIIACKENGTSDWIENDLPYSAEKLRVLYSQGYGSPDSCQFKEGFKKISPPRIPWFKRSEQY